MKKFWIGLIIVVVALALGIAGAWGAVSLYKSRVASTTNTSVEDIYIPGAWAYGGAMKGGYMHSENRGAMMRGYVYVENSMSCTGGMMRRWGYSSTQTNSERIDINQATQKADEYLSDRGYIDSLEISEVMAFENNFYVLVIEKDSGIGAFELLVNPYSGMTCLEPGANTMWNQKYGLMRIADSEENNTINLKDAKELAEEALEKNISGDVKIEDEGMEFYGYYTFDYEVDGQVAGMLSVNGTSGDIWFHNWHGDFLSEKE